MLPSLNCQSYSVVRSGKGCGAKALCLIGGSSQVRIPMQVLKDAELKAAYDKQLDGGGHKGGVFISNEVSTSIPIHLYDRPSGQCTPLKGSGAYHNPQQHTA